MIAKNPDKLEDSAPPVITDISDQAKERHELSSDNFEQLDAWLGIQKEKKMKMKTANKA